jgi:glucokinase
MRTKEFCAGIDVGGTKISSALFTKDGDVVGKTKVSIDKTGGDGAAGQIAGILRSLDGLAERKEGRLLAAALCVPGVVYKKTGLVWAPNIPGWDHYPLGERIKQAYAQSEREDTPEARVSDVSLPRLVIDSDRSAYVMGEQWRGAAKGARDAVFLAVGTGIGAGIFAEGRIVHGSEDIAVGWFALDPAFKDEYAAMGCFEAEASGNSVGRKATRLLADGRPSLMRELAGGDTAKITAAIVAEAARKNDPVARAVINDTVAYLAMGIANIVSILNPEIIVLGGGLFQASELLLEPIKRDFKRWAQPLSARSVRIELSELGEDAGLYGCGKLAWDSVEGILKGEP